MAPVAEVSGEPHGRLPSYILAEALEPAEQVLLQSLFWLTLVVVLVALVDLVARGRIRTISLTLTRMLTALGPLLGLYGAANVLVKASLSVREPSMIAGFVGPAALLVSAGALCGCVGVVLAAVLKLIPAGRIIPARSASAP